jgi:hypothetical protein
MVPVVDTPIWGGTGAPGLMGSALPTITWVMSDGL